MFTYSPDPLTPAPPQPTTPSHCIILTVVRSLRSKGVPHMGSSMCHIAKGSSKRTVCGEACNSSHR
eukprot:13970681-Alexandrium_andersonii.AAC.1